MQDLPQLARNHVMTRADEHNSGGAEEEKNGGDAKLPDRPDDGQGKEGAGIDAALSLDKAAAGGDEKEEDKRADESKSESDEDSLDYEYMCNVSIVGTNGSVDF